MRHSRLQLFLASLFIVALSFPMSRGDERPNVLIFLADDLAYHDLGPYGNHNVNTPALDRLAADGKTFNYAYNSSPMCAPTRMSLYTGIHPVRNGAYPNHSRVHQNIRSIPDLFLPLGYRVALLGKTHEAPKENFDFEFLGGRHHDNGNDVDLEIEKVDTFMQESKGSPWFLVVASNQSHTPWNRGDAAKYRTEDIWIPPYLVDTPETREELRSYYAEIEYQDTQFAHCLTYLANHDLEENTIVIYLSEQGPSLAFGKWTCYETGLRSAVIVRWPAKVAASTRSNTFLQYVDIVPTLLDAVGPEKGDLPQFDGKSLLAELTGSGTVDNPYAFGVQTSENSPHGAIPEDWDGESKPGPYAIRTIRDHRYRLIWNLHHDATYYNKSVENNRIFKSWVQASKDNPHAAKRVENYRERPEYELFDHFVDPWELDNLADSPAHAAIKERLLSSLKTWMEQQGDRGQETEEAGRFRARGRRDPL